MIKTRVARERRRKEGNHSDTKFQGSHSFSLLEVGVALRQKKKKTSKEKRKEGSTFLDRWNEIKEEKKKKREKKQ